MNNPNTTNRSVVSAIIEKEENQERLIYIQTRWKPDTSPTYSGLLEIPAGGIDGYENVIEALRREVKEETGLEVTDISNGFVGNIEENIVGSKAIIFQPFLCQQMLSSDRGLPWIGFVFRCKVEGVVKVNPDEAKEPQWISMSKLKKLLDEKPQSFFPLQYPVLKYYTENS